MAAPQVLTQDHLNQINQALQALNDADELMVRAAQAGIDVSSQQAQSQSARTQLQRIKQAFFPNG